MGTILLAMKPEALDQSYVDAIHELAPSKTVLISDDHTKIEAALDDIEIAVASFPRDLLPKARHLQWYQQWGAGADWLLRQPEAMEMDFILTNASGVHGVPISEHILAFMLAFTRNLHLAVRAQARHQWAKMAREEVGELAGQTMVLVGVGAIGERTAHVAQALGMRVLGIRRNPEIGCPSVEAMFGPDQLREVLPYADFLVLTIPLTTETRHMIGETELRAMKKDAHIINIGRGGTIDEQALVQALREGWIAGAGLDVFEREPLPADSPLWDMPNVIITSHYSGRTPRYLERGMEIFLDNLRRYQAGEPLRNVVNKKLGY